ncbi:MAG: hypothetical protein AAFV59_15530, partial [Pseudomonadota bacterium]
SWPQHAQVVVFLNHKSFNPVYGYLHFSSGYLRYVANRPDISGLVGSAESANRWPFVQKLDSTWATKGGEYWAAVDGKTTRYRMIGLVQDRPLFVYRQLRDGSIVSAAHTVFVDATGLRSIQKGAAPNSRIALDRHQGICKLSTDTTVVWPHSTKNLSEIRDSSASDLILPDWLKAWSTSLNVTSAALTDGDRLVVTFEVRHVPNPVSNRNSNEEVVLQLPGFELRRPKYSNSQLLASIKGQPYVVDVATGATQIVVWGQEGCDYMLEVSGKPVGLLRSSQLAGTWRLHLNADPLIVTPDIRRSGLLLARDPLTK